MNERLLSERPATGARLFGPVCGNCGSSRTGRIEGTTRRECAVCGIRGTILVRPVALTNGRTKLTVYVEPLRETR